MAARSFNRGSLGDSFRRAPIGSAMQLMLDAFPEIEQVTSYVSEKVATLTGNASADNDDSLLPPEAQRAAAGWEVRRFCESYSSTCIEPTEAELQEMSRTIDTFSPEAATCAIYDQLASWGRGGDLDWQPRLRVLLLWEHLLCQPTAMGTAASTMVFDLQQLLRFLSEEVPQCKNAAQRLLNHCNPSQPSGLGRGRVVDIDTVMSYPAAPVHDAPAHVHAEPARSVVRESADKPDCPDDTASLPSTSDDQFDPDIPLSESEEAVPDEHATSQMRGLDFEVFQKAKAETPGEARPYLWLSSVDAVVMERAQDPFENLMSDASPL
eukprot:gb/GFBE01044993.1/.p1 GENE.gb/GFBE01044993.1/~~gb/GFBE01044993.1/.p1  ORF type:complete len:323 (+),score=65.33 gb/GFBE01044993.1/:1-969(+)